VLFTIDTSSCSLVGIRKMFHILYAFHDAGIRDYALILRYPFATVLKEACWFVCSNTLQAFTLQFTNWKERNYTDQQAYRISRWRRLVEFQRNKCRFLRHCVIYCRHVTATSLFNDVLLKNTAIKEIPGHRTGIRGPMKILQTESRNGQNHPRKTESHKA
jgi:hypothetical protein